MNLCKETPVPMWPHLEDFMGKSAANGLRRGELFMVSARCSGKSIYEKVLTMRMLKERQPALKADLFWIDDCLYLGDPWEFNYQAKEFKKKFSTEVLDQPEVVSVQWANFISKEI